MEDFNNVHNVDNADYVESTDHVSSPYAKNNINYNAFDEKDVEANQNNANVINSLVGKIISEKYLSDFINEEIFFIGEVVGIEDNKISLKSVNGKCVECVIQDRNFKAHTKYVGIKGTVSDDLKIIETRGVIFLEDINFEIVNEYINIYMQNINSDVFLSSY
ncbi:conserved Plasmodium protein, unknown function [Plasmodium malariae]|uniref:Replication factor A protein 3 n=1 Tax=Plasmodium malariae TaxID=5858 RepID=A0A1D3JK65_PLAMA|nr:conserved Plasmodium protein, unknown function [Plasmodium malariae]SBT86918.1 conserved Plasmodium protein, unknown function [Plasmodium malariae]